MGFTGRLALGNPLWWPSLHALWGLGSDADGNPLSAGRVWLVPVWMARAATVSRLGMRVATAVSGSSVRIGLYGDNGGTPNGARLLADSGSLDSGTAGAINAVFPSPVSLQRGLAWGALEASDAGLRFTRHVPTTFTEIGSEILGGGFYDRAGGFGPLTDPCPAPTSNINMQFLAKLRLDGFDE